ncbi:hypothetical protein ACTWQF_30120 [Streptomyces sp. 8N114]|uniref:hypothetical protein n=1 Tax=Streptomyces sp. 8N114 TaxID=3457419 RepID=UPI003FD48A95
MRYDDDNWPSSWAGPLPDEDAEWFDITGRGIVPSVVMSCVALVIGCAALRLVFADGSEVSSRVVLCVIALLLLGVAYGLLRTVVSVLRKGRIRFGVDGHGVWWWMKDGAALVPWEEMHGLGTAKLERPLGTAGKMRFTDRVEVFPYAAPDARHQVLRHFHRGGEPAREGLRGPYLQLVLPSSTAPGSSRRSRASIRVEEAVRRRCPAQWLGHETRQLTPDDRAVTTPGTRR